MENAGTTSAVESAVTNRQARTSPLPNPVVPQTGTKASKRGDSGAKAKPAAAKKRRSKHGFLGVHQRTYGRWSAEIRDNVIKGSRLWIGTFDTALDAALAYDAVSRRLYGLNAKTNFPAAAGGEALQLHQAAKEMQHQWRSWRRRGAAASRGYSGGGSSWRGADKPTVQRGGAGAGGERRVGVHPGAPPPRRRRFAAGLPQRPGARRRRRRRSLELLIDQCKGTYV